FVRNHHLPDMLRGKVRQTMLRLVANHLFGLSGLVLIEVFTDADDRMQLVVQSGQGLLIHQFVAFAKVGATFGVTKNNGGAEFMYHRGGNLAREGTLLLVVHILRAQLDTWKMQRLQYMMHGYQ